MSGHGVSGHGATDLTVLAPGTRLDQYVIKTVLGAGGFGITYLAEHPILRKQFAIKEHFPRDFATREGRTVRATSTGAATYEWSLERFMDEARTLAKFKHASIVDVTSVFESNGTAYMALAFEKGKSFEQWLLELGRAPSQAELDRILVPLLEALEVIHSHNVMHRDIAPDNILIRTDGTPVLLDFGAAREAARKNSRAVSVIVKRSYSPPEQYSTEARHQGPWTDIFALAATLYHAITGAPPDESTDRMITDRVASAAKAARGKYRPQFLAAIDQALRLRPEERPQSIRQWRPMLLAGAQTVRGGTAVGGDVGRTQGVPAARRAAPLVGRTQPVDPSQPPSGLLPDTPSPPRSPWALLAAVSVAVLIPVGGLAIWQYTKSDSSNVNVATRPPVVTTHVRDAFRTTPGSPQAVIPRELTPQEVEALKNEAQHEYSEGDKHLNGRGVTKDLTRARELFESAARKGSVAAMNDLGFMYSNGVGVAKNDMLAVQWFELAAKHNHATAENNLGLHYRNGRGVQKDLNAARQFFERSAAKNNNRAMLNLSDIYRLGEGVPIDYTLARQWAERAADAGNGFAHFRSATFYQDGLGVPKDYNKALEWLNKGAAKGDGSCMNEIGRHFAAGWGNTKVDFEKAREWFEKAASAGAPVGLYNLAFFRDRGRIGSNDYVGAARLLLSAARAGESNARSALNGDMSSWNSATRVALQQELARAGHYNGATHGIWDEATKQAVQRYLAANPS